MKGILRLSIVSVFALLLAAPAMVAQIPVASTLVLDEPTDVGGTIIQPGTYLIRILPSNTNRNQVQITSLDRETIHATVLTVPRPVSPNEPMPNTMFVFYPAAEGLPRALRTWYPTDPPSQAGQDFVYEESRAKQLARAANANVVSYADATRTADFGTTELHVVTPQATVETYTYTPPAPLAPPAPVIVETTEVERRTQVKD